MNLRNTPSRDDRQPLVTFIVTAYNLPIEQLRQCLDSIRALSLNAAEREIILVDDGSDEPPISALADYLDDILYIRQRNAGLSAARNRGIGMATGEFLQFVDGDDYLLQAAYEHCLDQVRYGGADVVMFDLTDDATDSQPADYNATDMDSGTELMAHHNIQGSACGYLFRRHILGELRFTPGIYHEDEEFTPQLLLRAERICSTDAQAYFYRRRQQSITGTADVRTVVRRLADKRQVISRLSAMADTLPNNDRLALQRRVAQLTMDYIYTIIIETRSRHFLDRKLASLRSEGLFPLPDRHYTTKYTWFRRMTNSSLGLSLLMRALPLLKKER
jgi:glycosyltransferase involved in cell wall biosynthesis